MTTQTQSALDAWKTFLERFGCIYYDPTEDISIIEQALTSAPSQSVGDDVIEQIKKKWLEIKPSRTAQSVRASITIDSGKFNQPEADSIPSWAWDLVDIAIQETLNKYAVHPAPDSVTDDESVRSFERLLDDDYRFHRHWQSDVDAVRKALIKAATTPQIAPEVVTVEEIAELLHIEVDTRFKSDMYCISRQYPNGVKIEGGA